MNNPNSLNQNPENSSAETGWESVAAEADKKDWGAQAAESEHQQPENSQEERLGKLAALRQQMKNLAQPATKEAQEKTKEPELTVEQKVAKKEEAYRERIEKFAEGISQDALGRICIKEIVHIQKLERRLDKYAESKDHSFMERRQHDKEIQELKRYGYKSGGHNEDSNRFKELKKLSKDYGVSPQERIEYGERRARDFKTIDIYLNSENGRKIKKDLREKGYKTIPEKWNDDNLTTHEMHEMADYVKFRGRVHAGLYDK